MTMSNEEANAALDQYDEQLARKSDDAVLNEVCPCGHPAHKHEGAYGDGPCSVPHCECPEFGTDPSEYDPPTQVWFTEPPGGHYGYE